MLPPIIETERLILRPIEMSDAAEHNKCMKDWEIIRNFAKGFPHPYPDIKASEEFITRIRTQDEIIYWAIAEKNEPNTMIGTIELRPHFEKSHRAFWLSRDHHNKGYITEATIPVNDYWFGVLGQEKMYVENALGNIASRRIKEKTGGKLLGTKKSEHVDPTLDMIEEWVITKNDWKTFIANKKSSDETVTA